MRVNMHNTENTTDFALANFHLAAKMNSCDFSHTFFVTVTNTANYASQEQQAAFSKWRSHARRHPEGVVVGSELGHGLPVKVLLKAVAVSERSKPATLRNELRWMPYIWHKGAMNQLNMSRKRHVSDLLDSVIALADS